jgi:BirA family biotin operon repressor/biotin-[acetyl-CoA-carboxylase] ligase
VEWKIIHIDETDSTNRWLRENMQTFSPLTPADSSRDSGEKAVTVVTEYQTAGRGCGSNTWESERGKNLTFSVLLHPTEIPADCQFRISEAVSVAICETLERCFCPLSPKDSSPDSGEQKVTIKWPNDIYVGDKKICGILIENQLRGRLISDSIVGIGLNVNQTVFRSDAPNPVSIAQLTGHEEDREALLQAFHQRLSVTMEMEPEALMEAYRSRLYRREGFYKFSDCRGEFEAKVMNVLDDGRLVLLDTEGTARMYAFKEVRFLIED